MPRGVEQAQLQNMTVANQRSGELNADRLNAMNTIVPALTQEVTNPQGFSPNALRDMNTASIEGVGGATAGAVGQNNLEAARTRNAGGFQAANDEAARQGQRQISQNALGVQTANEMQRQKNQQAGMQGLTGIYGIDTGATLQALGLANQAAQGASQSSQANAQNSLGWFNAIANAAGKAAAGFA